MVLAVGFDLVTISRFGRMIERYGDRLLCRLFTEDERRYCDSYSHPAQHYAARFAAKEAILKALGVPPGLRWHQLEVISSESREPSIRLSGRAKEVAAKRGIRHMLVTLTHELDLAAAMVIAEGELPPSAVGST